MGRRLRAWLFLPLTLFSEPVADALWTVLFLAALGWVWYIAAPYTGLAKITLLLLAVAMWLVLRTSPPLWHRMWLLVGIATMQAVTLGPPTLELLWDAGWLGILAASSLRRRAAPAIA